ncbi:MAG TPA: permease [Oceanospirillales bacterium]|jgi:uncharacterized membrane protein YfcA|nr:permease [Oceanospirillales bacterium]|tara:strand:- start:3494 stop:4249 length:756 start_codon:yes stop_codon:yes gene_type:complete
MDYTQHLLLFVIAVIANWFSALAGGGAGLIQLPILIFMGLPFSLALATHKIATVALGIGATVRHLKEKHSSMRLLALILLAGIPGVVLGAYSIIEVDDRLAEVVLGLLTLSLALYSIIKSDLGLVAKPIHRDTRGVITGALGLFIIGIANGALSAGSGLFVTLWLVYWFGLSYRLAVAHTLIAVGLGWNASGALTMTLFAEVKWDWLPALLLGSLVGGYLGAHSSIMVGSIWIKRCYELVTLLVAAKLLMG